jgi:adenylate kinase family enzyme
MTPKEAMIRHQLAMKVANAYLTQLPLGRSVLFVCGPSTSGKTTMAKILATQKPGTIVAMEMDRLWPLAARQLKAPLRWRDKPWRLENPLREACARRMGDLLLQDIESRIQERKNGRIFRRHIVVSGFWPSEKYSADVLVRLRTELKLQVYAVLLYTTVEAYAWRLRERGDEPDPIQEHLKVHWKSFEVWHEMMAQAGFTSWIHAGNCEGLDRVASVEHLDMHGAGGF